MKRGAGQPLSMYESGRSVTLLRFWILNISSLRPMSVPLSWASKKSRITLFQATRLSIVRSVAFRIHAKWMWLCLIALIWDQIHRNNGNVNSETASPKT